MINVNELRIGNWLKPQHDLDGEYHLVVELRKNNDTGVLTVNSYIEDWYSPIPLTPEILEKCDILEDHGFFKLADLYFVKEFSKGYKMEIHNKEGKEFYTLNNEILYLHQLQNLYFSLTGEELNINL